MFKKIGFIVIAILTLNAHAETFVAGTDFVIIQDGEKNNSSGTPIRVTEFFSYGCPWCYKIEPALNEWVAKQGAAITYKKIPVVFNETWVYYAKAYYTADALSLTSEVSPALFEAILKEKRPLNSNDSMIDFLSSHGVDQSVAKSAFNNSPSIEMKLKEGNRKMGQYQISGVPAVVINQRFKTDLQMAKSETRFFDILNYLVAKSVKDKAGSVQKIK